MKNAYVNVHSNGHIGIGIDVAEQSGIHLEKARIIRR